MINELNKRMPYSVPEGFFDEMENNVMNKLMAEMQSSQAEMQNRQAKRAERRTRTVCLSVLAVAASLLLLFTVARPGGKSVVPSDDMEQIDRAFNQLSKADQKYLLEVYGDNVLIDYTTVEY